MPANFPSPAPPSVASRLPSPRAGLRVPIPGSNSSRGLPKTAGPERGQGLLGINSCSARSRVMGQRAWGHHLPWHRPGHPPPRAFLSPAKAWVPARTTENCPPCPAGCFLANHGTRHTPLLVARTEGPPTKSCVCLWKDLVSEKCRKTSGTGVGMRGENEKVLMSGAV